MKPRTRIPTRRERPRRKRPELTKRPKQVTGFLDSRSYVTKGGRVRLFGEDMLGLRLDAYFRAKGFCEAKRHHPACPIFVGNTQGHLAHKKHGPHKTDTLQGVEWRSPVCHLIQQHNPKPCPRKVKAA